MTLSVFAYTDVFLGQGVQPPQNEQLDQALGAAITVGPGYRWVDVISSADAYIRVTSAGSAATSTHQKVTAGERYGFPVQQSAGVKIYGIATS